MEKDKKNSKRNDGSNFGPQHVFENQKGKVLVCKEKTGKSGKPYYSIKMMDYNRNEFWAFTSVKLNVEEKYTYSLVVRNSDDSKYAPSLSIIKPLEVE